MADLQDIGDTERQNLLTESLAVQTFQSELLKGLLLFQLGNEKAARTRSTKAKAKANLQERTEMGRFDLKDASGNASTDSVFKRIRK